MPYGYEPSQYLQKDRTGIGTASQIIGSAVASIPAYKREEEKAEKEKELFQQEKIDRQDAVRAAGKNWRDMETAYTVIRNKYASSPAVQQLLDSGKMTREELSANVLSLKKPTSIDKKDPGAYIDNLVASLKKLGEDATKRQRQGQLGQMGQQAQRQAVEGAPQQVPTPGGQVGAGFTEQNITERGAPVDTEQFTQRFGQIAAGEGVAPTKEEITTQQELSGTQPAQQVATQQRQQKKDVEAAARQKEQADIAKTQRDFENDLKRQRNEREKAKARIEAEKGGKGVNEITMNEVSEILQFQVTDYNKRINALDMATNIAKQNKDQGTADANKIKKAELDGEKKAAMQSLMELIKLKTSGKIAPKIAPDAPTVQDISAKFGYLPPAQLSAIGDLLKNENPDTPGEMWTLDDIFKKFKATKPGYQAPSFGAQ